jgi:hypothetical protein
MEAVRETTGGLFPAHIYLLDGSNLISYIKRGETEPFYFKHPIKGFDRRGRKFVPADVALFQAPAAAAENALIEVQGSKGATYWVDPEAKTCTCPGFTFRGDCKHIKELA